MDLAAFLPTGLHPVHLEDDSEGPWGYLLLRPGRPPSWLVRTAQAPDAPVELRIVFEGWRQASDGTLAAGPGAAVITLSGRVLRSRPFNGFHLVRFGRLLRRLD